MSIISKVINYDVLPTKVADFLRDTPNWKLVAGGGLVLLGGYYAFFKDNSGLPGPRGYPIVGILPLLDKKAPHLSIYAMSEKYGDVCSLSFLSDDFVLVSGEKNIYDIYINKQDDFSNRLRNVRIATVLDGLMDITSMNDCEKFRDVKKLTMRSLKTYGEGMERVEDISTEVIGDFINFIAETKGKPLDISKKLKDVFGDIITSMVLNKRVSNTITQKFVHNYDRILTYTINPFTAIIEFFPWLKYFGNHTYKTLRNFVKLRNKLINPLVESAFKEYDPDDIKTAFQQIVFLMNQSKFDYNLRDMTAVVIVLIVAGFVTTSSTLYGLFPILMAHRHVEEKILQEISEVIGFDRSPKLSDKANMPYTEATILEAHRILSILPFSLPHQATRNTTLGGYNIKKGTTIWPNIWGLHHDKEIWGDPYNFRPERFLDKDGKVLSVEHRLRKCLLPFGAGRRVCLGKNMANNRLFLFLTTVLQRFKFQPEEGKTVLWDPKEMEYSVVLCQKPYKMSFLPRQS
ncbi:DgyrCDS11593 [Dimorphilus gyrociliatus]|uniref:DgyrCDS11593 n=1 Tax=Dimorphilus gyrociliatus TaxID=2664684 RepID=A0A7I8W3U5_9ANNE|nr:DgyrCDS11593 [Dimorphilus gyrociliatus]